MEGILADQARTASGSFDQRVGIGWQVGVERVGKVGYPGEAEGMEQSGVDFRPTVERH